ncbi:hypothetical protein GJ496_005601 [Pomphorhynchus laevis]|nr:hypothetical protein GJ496_005601 [Pomphorhynchus laevis]
MRILCTANRSTSGENRMRRIKDGGARDNEQFETTEKAITDINISDLIDQIQNLDLDNICCSLKKINDDVIVCPNLAHGNGSASNPSKELPFSTSNSSAELLKTNFNWRLSPNLTSALNAPQDGRFTCVCRQTGEFAVHLPSTCYSKNHMLGKANCLSRMLSDKSAAISNERFGASHWTKWLSIRINDNQFCCCARYLSGWTTRQLQNHLTQMLKTFSTTTPENFKGAKHHIRTVCKILVSRGHRKFEELINRMDVRDTTKKDGSLANLVDCLRYLANTIETSQFQKSNSLQDVHIDKRKLLEMLKLCN